MRSFAAHLIESYDSVVRGLQTGHYINVSKFLPVEHPPSDRQGNGYLDADYVERHPKTQVTQLSLTSGQLVATQDGVNADSIRGLLEKPMSAWALGRTQDLPKVVVRGKKHYIVDGHHRIIAALIKKLPTIKAAVLAV